MLLIFVPKLTNRTGYTINVVMRDMLHVEFAITTDADTFANHDGPKLCYGPQPVGPADVPFLQSAKLLFETQIQDVACGCFRHQDIPVLFPVFSSQSALPFDPFAAIFYMLSRYEEMLPFIGDEHGRFPVSQSIAYKNGFLGTAVVDRWALMVRDLLQQRYPDLYFAPRQYAFEPTIDIDAAYCYKHKGVFRTTLGILRDGLKRHAPQEVRRRIAVIRGQEADPYDTFDYILETARELAPRAQLTFFALLGDYGMYDKPASYSCNQFRQLIQHLRDYAKVGIHGSYYSADEPERIEREVERLSDILHRPIVRNRFHFLRFTLPYAYQNLVGNGITHDYSMGFSEVNGFRCGTCNEYPFFDLTTNQETQLHIHPFIAMDTTMNSHLGLSPDEAAAAYRSLIDETRAVGGTFCCIFHNQNLCEDFGWEGWRAVFEEVMRYAAANTNKPR